MLLHRVVGRPRRVDGPDQDVRRVEAEVGALQPEERLQQQPRRR